MSEVSHVPVLLEEAVNALRVREGETYVDGTFGRGGHSKAILARLGVRGRLLAFDQDPAAVSDRAFEDPRLELIHARFSTMHEALAARGIGEVAGVLLDIGTSSPQLDDAARGFSFSRDGPLDMRMDNSRGATAADFVNRAEESELRKVISEYGEERFAKQVAAAIAAARRLEPIRTTRQLAEIVGRAVRTREPGQHPATRTFQALRIHVNQELEELEVTLPQAAGLLAPAGRLAVVSFHSLEDRIVKNFIRERSTADRLPRGVPVRAKDLPTPQLTAVGRAIRASEAEVSRNPRARSAVLRVAEKN
jgi:16S rRNA (cytosine1402-N4)-methyltransferase